MCCYRIKVAWSYSIIVLPFKVEIYMHCLAFGEVIMPCSSELHRIILIDISYFYTI